MRDALHVVGLSGGKDSTALALRLADIEPRDYTYLCTPTGDELPELYAHWSRLELLLCKPITKLTASVDLNGLIEREQMIPNWRARFCTRVLKIEPCQQWINAQAHPVILYIGLRADEAGREGGIYENCEVRFPFREWGWGLREVINYLDEKNISIPSRTDCGRCFFQRLPEWYALWKDYPGVYADAEAQEAQLGHTFRSGGRDSYPAALKDLRAEFERGNVPRGTQMTASLFDFSANQCRACSL